MANETGAGRRALAARLWDARRARRRRQALHLCPSPPRAPWQAEAMPPTRLAGAAASPP
jgi:hypothetical protein